MLPTVRAKDIAKEIGVSEATVFLMINGKPGISDKTRMKVSSKIRELGYGYLLSENEENDGSLKTIGFVIYNQC